VPVYEYRCNNCRRKVSIYVKSFSEMPQPICACGSRELTRLFSTFARIKTDKDVYEDILSDSDLVKRMMADDPRALVEWSRRMEGGEGEENPEYQEMMERLEKGENWQKVVTEMQQRELASETESHPELTE